MQKAITEATLDTSKAWASRDHLSVCDHPTISGPALQVVLHFEPTDMEGHEVARLRFLIAVTAYDDFVVGMRTRVAIEDIAWVDRKHGFVGPGAADYQGAAWLGRYLMSHHQDDAALEDAFEDLKAASMGAHPVDTTARDRAWHHGRVL